MHVKTQLLKLLEENKNEFISGSSIASELSISRTAVWKAVKSLRSEGYEILATTNSGYKLVQSGDILSSAGIARSIKTEGVFIVEVKKTVSSTNKSVRELAMKGMPEGYVLAAEGQTAGKGRMGRWFYSPLGHGIYFSLLLRPGSKTKDASLITAAAAVATAQAIEKILGVKTGIKWVNDLFIRDKKVCGILTEAVFGMESGLVESAVLGIGVNVTKPKDGIPKELEKIITTVTERTEGTEGERCRLIAAVLDKFWEYYQNLERRDFLDEYRKRSIIIGRDILVISGEEKTPAHALAIDNECGLVVRYENGAIATLNSGEVSIRTSA